MRVCTWAANIAEVVLPDPPLPKKVTNFVDCWEELLLQLPFLPPSSANKDDTTKAFLRRVKWGVEFASRRAEGTKEAIFCSLEVPECGGRTAVGWEKKRFYEEQLNPLNGQKQKQEQIIYVWRMKIS